MAKAPKKNTGRITVKNIADYAGVSIGAVSSVLTNRHVERRISHETAKRIRTAIKELGYLPDINARRLRTNTKQKQNIVLAFITSFETPLSLVNDLILELRKTVGEKEDSQSGMTFSVMVELFQAGRLKDMPGLSTGEHFNAAIIANTTPEDDQFLNRAHLPFPVVLVNRSIPRYSCVVEDPDAGGIVSRLLMQSRRRNLAVLHGSPLTQSTQGRVDRFMQTVSSQLGSFPQEIIAEHLSESAAYDATVKFLDQGNHLDGLYAVTDGMALGAYHAIREKGLTIPKDVSVFGVGDYDISPFFDPPLSVVGVRRDELGRETSRLLLRQIENGSSAPLLVEIPVQPILRDSSDQSKIP